MTLSFIEVKYDLPPQEFEAYSIGMGQITSTFSIDGHTQGFVMSTGGTVEAEYQSLYGLETMSLTNLRFYTPEHIQGINITNIGFARIPMQDQITEDDLNLYTESFFFYTQLTEHDDIFSADYFSNTSDSVTPPTDVNAGDGSDTLSFEDNYYSSNYNFGEISESSFYLGKNGQQVKYHSFEYVEFNDTGRIAIDQLPSIDPGATLDNTNSIARLYVSALDRLPDLSGLNNWVDELEQGMSLSDIAGHFINSEEFKLKYEGLDNTGFITELYKNVLDRAPDTDGLSNWVSQLEQGFSKESILLGFSDSAESKNNTQGFFHTMSSQEGEWVFTFSAEKSNVEALARLYQSAFDRTPDALGINHWVDQYEQGDSMQSIASQFIDSAEFQSLYGTPTDDEFISLLYQNVLDRAPDADGYNANLNALTSSSREDLLLVFSNSLENIENTEAQFASIHSIDNIWYGF